MATTKTTRAKLGKPGAADRDWNLPLNANADALDAVNAIGALAVTAASAGGLAVDVAAGMFAKLDGTPTLFTGSTGYAVPASATTLVWLTDAGAVASGASWPTTPHIRLASVTTGASGPTAIADQRIPYRVATPAQGPFTITFAGTSTTLGASPTLTDVTNFLASVAAALKTKGILS